MQEETQKETAQKAKTAQKAWQKAARQRAAQEAALAAEPAPATAAAPAAAGSAPHGVASTQAAGAAQPQEAAPRVQQEAPHDAADVKRGKQEGSAAPASASTDWMLCPITREVMRDPKLAADSNSYERAAIEAWLLSNEASPLTGERMPHKDVIPNHSLRSVIQSVTAAGF